METQAHMDIARWAGVSSFGSVRPGMSGAQLPTLLIGEPPINSNIVLKTPDERFLELYNDGGAMAIQPIAPLWTPGRDPMIGVYGKSTNSCIWIRGPGATAVGFVDEGVYKLFTVSDLGNLSVPAVYPGFNPQGPGVCTLGGTLESPSRVVVDSAPGTPSGLVLQSLNGTPWVVWIDQTSALRVTNWATFRLGQPE
jgi:hypothetical protein